MSTGQRVAIYARISEDTTGEGVKVADQLTRCRTLADDRGWQVVEEITDNDLSALTGKHRPGYARVLELVNAGEIDHVVVWQTSRLLRNRRERAEAIELFGRQRVGIIAVKGVSFDLTTAYGRGQAGLLGEFDTMESEVKAERIAAAAAERAAAGRPSGALGYGWRKIGIGRSSRYVEEPHEAAVVREIVDRLLAGESVRGVTESLNARGEPAPNSASWGKTSVRKIALRESNIGVRVHHRGKPDEARYEGTWPPLMDRMKYEQLAALLGRAGRRTNAIARPGARRHLLSGGVGECGVCGGPLRGHRRQGRYGRPLMLYTCEPKGCVGRNMEFVDLMVRDVVIGRLSRPDALDWLLGDEDEARRLSARLDDLHRRLDEAADSYAEGEITREQLRRITARVQPEIDETEAARKRAARSLDLEVLGSLAGPQALERWEAMTVAQRRAVVEVLDLRVKVNPTAARGPIWLAEASAPGGRRPGPGFDPESVVIEWRQGDG